MRNNPFTGGRSADSRPYLFPDAAYPAVADLRKGITKPSYLFGTMHILCASDARLTIA
jgi:hypothetical protein